MHKYDVKKVEMEEMETYNYMGLMCEVAKYYLKVEYNKGYYTVGYYKP